MINSHLFFLIYFFHWKFLSHTQTHRFILLFSTPMLLLLLLSHFSRVRLCATPEGSPPGSPVPGILQARTLEWVAISFSNAWKWKVKVKSLSRVRLFATPRTAAYQAPLSMDFPGKSIGVGCHCLLRSTPITSLKTLQKMPYHLGLNKKFHLCMPPQYFSPNSTLTRWCDQPHLCSNKNLLGVTVLGHIGRAPSWIIRNYYPSPLFTVF